MKNTLVTSLLGLSSFQLIAAPTIYGSLELALAHTDQGTAVNPVVNSPGVSSNTGGDSGTFLENNWSYIGFKGKEQLYPSLAVMYQIEMAVQDDSIDGVDDPVSSRNTYLGLESHWGSLLFGRMNTTYSNATSNVDIFDNTNAWLAQLIPGENKHSKSVSYYSPLIVDLFSLSGTMLMEDEHRDHSYPYTLAITAGDANLSLQPWFFAIAYNRKVEDFTGYRAAAQVQFGDVQIGGIFQHSESESYQNLEGNSYYVNARYNLRQFGWHNVNLKLMYGKEMAGLGDYFQEVIGANTNRLNITDVDIQQITVGGNYHASQSAIFYAFWANYSGDYRQANSYIKLARENVYTIGLRYYF